MKLLLMYLAELKPRVFINKTHLVSVDRRRSKMFFVVVIRFYHLVLDNHILPGLFTLYKINVFHEFADRLQSQHNVRSRTLVLARSPFLLLKASLSGCRKSPFYNLFQKWCSGAAEIPFLTSMTTKVLRFTRLMFD